MEECLSTSAYSGYPYFADTHGVNLYNKKNYGYKKIYRKKNYRYTKIFRTGGGPTRKWKWISWKIRANDFDITFFTLSRYDSRPLKKFLQKFLYPFLRGKPPKPELCEFFPAQPEVVSKIGRRLNSSWTCQSLKLFTFLGWGVRGAPQKFPKFSVQNSYPPGIVRILP